jgi:hypothetical protein
MSAEPTTVTPAPPPAPQFGPTWQSVTLVVAPIVIAAVLSTVASIFAYLQARDASITSKEAKTKAIETHDLVNSRLSELLPLIKKGAADAATLEEKQAQKGREGAVAAATKTEQTSDQLTAIVTAAIKEALAADAAAKAKTKGKP